MATERLYYQDTYIRNFTATVRSCEKQGKHYAVTLDRTAFFPEGGGQAPDRGTLNGVAVLDVQEREDEVLHFCAAPFTLGQPVEGCLDWTHRFCLMQQHSGEHLVSGIIHQRYGWDNVGFHMGADVITIDFNGPIPPEDLPKIELAANEAVWKNLETEIFYPTPEELAKIPYRSKKALTGQVRLVRFPGVDLCACCGTHVRYTGEIGIIKLLNCVKFREGVRMEMMCGFQAYQYLSKAEAQNHAISVLLSAKPLETAAAVHRIYDERNAALYRLTAEENRRFAQIARAMEGKGDCLIFETALTSDQVRKLAVAVMERCGGRCAVFSGDENSGYKYAIGEENGDLRTLVKEMNAALQGRGGGKPFFAQGSVQAKKGEIEAFFECSFCMDKSVLREERLIRLEQKD